MSQGSILKVGKAKLAKNFSKTVWLPFLYFVMNLPMDCQKMDLNHFIKVIFNVRKVRKRLKILLFGNFLKNIIDIIQ